MLNNLKLQYFKSFVSENIGLKKLTILTGLNSSGKSSVIQSIRMLEKANIGEKNVLLEGHGSLEEIINPKSLDSISISVASDNQSVYELILKKNEKIPKFKTDLAPFPELIYISADRFGPRSNIPLTAGNNKIGQHGENILHFIEQYQNEELNEKIKHENSEGNTLSFNLKGWLTEISPNIKFGYELQKKSDSSFTLFNEYRAANVGFGLSYTLPVITALLAGTFIQNSLVMIENPEAHLHPRGQTSISRLIALSASIGSQVIIETHSDHLFDGIRIAVKNGLISSEDVQIHWFELDEENCTKVFSPKIDKDGRLSFWYKGFFDQFEINSSELI